MPMLYIALFIALVILIALYTAIWRAHKREQATANRLAGNPKRAGRHRDTNRPVMTWRI